MSHRADQIMVRPDKVRSLPKACKIVSAFIHSRIVPNDTIKIAVARVGIATIGRQRKTIWKICPVSINTSTIAKAVFEVERIINPMDNTKAALTRYFPFLVWGFINQKMRKPKTINRAKRFFWKNIPRQDPACIPVSIPRPGSAKVNSKLIMATIPIAQPPKRSCSLRV